MLQKNKNQSLERYSLGVWTPGGDKNKYWHVYMPGPKFLCHERCSLGAWTPGARKIIYWHGYLRFPKFGFWFFFGTLVYWFLFFGTLVYWFFGTLDYWFFGSLELSGGESWARGPWGPQGPDVKVRGERILHERMHPTR